MPIKNVVLIGAGGNLGPALLNALTTSPHGYTVSVLSRQESTYQPPAGVTLLKTDYTFESLVSVLQGQDAIVSAIAGHAIPDQKKIIDAAIAAGVKRFIPSEYGCDTSNAASLKRVPVLSPKAQVREYLQSKQDQIEWTTLYTGPFLDWGLKIGFLGFKIPDATAEIYSAYKDVPFSASTLDFIGQAVAQALAPSIAPKTANKQLRVRSITATQLEILAVFEEATGKKWTVNEVDLDARVKEAGEKLKKGDFSGVGSLIVGAVFDVEAGNNFDRTGAVSNALLELPDGDIKAIVKSVL
ncbi:hypothetical protein VTN00DRAFT_5038 [Thermoascus crustaceus]|uniref:uncharacterized protein n=1 Tax=Thermoascus crustaceus TaxID=5088 RepID=UPI00374373D3